MLLSTRPISGHSEFSEVSTATSSTSGVPQQPKASTVDISKPIQQVAEHVYEDISTLNKALVSVPSSVEARMGNNGLLMKLQSHEVGDEPP